MVLIELISFEIESTDTQNQFQIHWFGNGWDSN